MPLKVIEKTLAAFNDGQLSPENACGRLGISRSRLYTLKTDWLAGGCERRFGKRMNLAV